MSFRLGQNLSRYNAGFVHSDSSGSPPLSSGAMTGSAPVTTPPLGASFQLQAATLPAAAAVAQSQPPLLYHHHRGHRRGHSYGGPVSPSTAAFHHAALESRPSHPNTHHGPLPSQMTGASTVNSALLKGHRRALSGCMPMVGMGVVAWSSLRELQTPTQPGVRSRSPEVEFNGDLRSSSPEAQALDKTLKSTGSPSSSDRLRIKEDDLKNMECGFGPCILPDSFHSFANIKFFVTILALLVTFQQAVASGYVNSVITTIETRFEIPSKFTGLVASSYEMGNVGTVLFVSYLGAKRHIPRWIAIGVLIMVIGCIVFTLPHFLSTDRDQYYEHARSSSLSNSYLSARLTQGAEDGVAYEFNSTNGTSLPNRWNQTFDFIDEMGPPTVNSAGRNSMCQNKALPDPSRHVDRSQQKPSESDSSDSDKSYPFVKKEEIGSVGNNAAGYTSKSYGCSIEKLEADGTLTTIEPESYGHPLILFMLAQLLLGCGGSPLFTLGITYVDDHVSQDSSSIYIGIIYAMAAFGPVLGFLTGAWFLLIPSSPNAAHPDGQFIGMWWGGFLIVGVLLFVVCLPFLTFPRFLPKEERKEDEYTPEEPQCQSQIVESSPPEASNGAATNSQYGQSIRDIPRSMWRLITNPVYVVTCLGGCMEMNIISGFIVFLPKYLETQFGLGKSEASLFTGGIAIPGACLGIFAGGYIMKKLQLKPSGAARFVVITNIICLVGHALFFFMGCNNPQLAGATVPYPGAPQPTVFNPLEVNLTAECNVDCSCDSSLDAQYVCHGGVTYFSPCHAGCSFNLTQCSCAGGADVTEGVCPDSPCNTLPAFMIVLFFMTATVAMTQMPLLMIVLRSVSPEERSFALGMQFVIFRLLGYIPSPIVFGNVIDSACLLWSIRRCSTLLPAVSGRCLRYDILDFRYKYVGMLTGFKLMAMALFMLDFIQLRKREKADEKAELTNAEMESVKLRSNSVISLDKLFEESCENEMETTTAGLSNQGSDALKPTCT